MSCRMNKKKSYIYENAYEKNTYINFYVEINGRIN